jgi:hypothetical protein
MAFTQSEWEKFMRNSYFFGQHQQIWQQFLENFRTLNIIDIIGVRYLLNDFPSVGMAFANPHFLNRGI